MLNKTSLALCLTAILCTTSVARASSELYHSRLKSTSGHQVARYGSFGYVGYGSFGYVGRYRDDPPGAEFQTRGLHRPD
jgi:hypothetical protein